MNIDKTLKDFYNKLKVFDFEMLGAYRLDGNEANKIMQAIEKMEKELKGVIKC